MITGITESKILTKRISRKCKCRFDGKNVIQIIGGIMINGEVNVKKAMYMKKTIFGILIHVVVKVENVLWMIQRIHVMRLWNHTMKKQKLFQQILMRRKQPVKHKISTFYLRFH